MKFFKVRSGFFAALAVAFGLPAQAAWVNINTFSSAESDYTWKAVHFLNTDTGWAVGSFKVNSTTTRGAILKTTNGGVTWTDQSILTNTEYSAIWFSDAQNGIIMGAGNRPGARTTDGGQTWTSVQASGYAMDFVSAMHGWIAGDNSTGRRTTDGGATWTAVTGLAGSFVDFTDMVTGWRIANQEQVLKTTDGGATWVLQLELAQAEANGGKPGHFLNATTGWVVGLSGQIRKTTNGGTTWVPQTSGTTRHLTHVSFSNANEGVAAGYSVLLRTTNGGNVWTVVDTTEGPAAFHVAAGQVYGVSAGRIYRQGTPTFVVPDLRATRNRAGVKPGTRTLQFSLERAVRVEASLFDVRGKLAAHLLSESRPAGAHRLGLPDHLTPGHYVLEFRAGDARQSIPVLLE